MQHKTIVKVISLYDFIKDNLLIILATLHHIIILTSYYYINALNSHIDIIVEHKDNVVFEELLINLEYCEIITLLTFAALYFVIISTSNNNLYSYLYI